MTLFLIGQTANGQTAQLHTWTVKVDSVTDTVHDSTWWAYSDQWHNVSFWFDGGAGYVRIGAPDTTNFTSIDWLKLEDSQILNHGPSPSLRRLQFKGTAGTYVTFYMVGTKRRSQY